MKLSTLLSALSALAVASAAAATDRTATIYIQPVSASAGAPALLAEVRYDTTIGAAEITSFEYPDLSGADGDEGARVRVGAYSAARGTWSSSTTVAAAANFAKGYAPTLVLTVDGAGAVVSAAVRGVRIDAGQTRDFGPQIVVRVEEMGRQPDLNRPVVLSPDGKKPEVAEKTLLQKYVCPFFPLRPS